MNNYLFEIELSSTKKLLISDNFSVNKISYSIALEPDLLELSGVFTAEAEWTKYFHNSMINCRVTLYEKDQIIFKGFIDSYALSAPEFTISCKSLKALFNNSLVSNYGEYCSANFCDSKCGLSVMNYTHEFEVTAIDGTKIAILRGSSNVNFENGYALHDHKKLSIISDNGDYIILNEGISDHDLSSIRLVAGCDKTYASCKHFGNTINFRGFPFK